MIIRFFVPGLAVPWKVPKVVRRANAKYPVAVKNQRLEAYQNRIAMAASEAMAGRPPLSVKLPLLLRIIETRPVPASWSKRRRQQALSGALWPTTRPDLDNIVKAVKDGCKQVTYEDDSSVVKLDVVKMYGLVPGVVVECLLVPPGMAQPTPEQFLLHPRPAEVVRA